MRKEWGMGEAESAGAVDRARGEARYAPLADSVRRLVDVTIRSEVDDEIDDEAGAGAGADAEGRELGLSVAAAPADGPASSEPQPPRVTIPASSSARVTRVMRAIVGTDGPRAVSRHSVGWPRPDVPGCCTLSGDEEDRQ